MIWRVVTLWAFCLITVGLSQVLWAQDASPDAGSPSAAPSTAPPTQTAKPDPKKPGDVGGSTLPPGEDPQNRLFLPVLEHMVQDQRTFWTFPFRLRTQDLRWVLPSAAFAGSVIASDSWIAKQVPQSASRIKQSKSLSNYAVFSLVGVTGGSYLIGHITHNDHMQETGLLGGEAAIDSTGVAYILKEITRRERPYQGNGHGTFFQGGTSFPSEHATVAWSAASVFAHEYPGTLSQIFAYGLASAVTVSRITSKQHFASDALIGSALGWYFGRQVYRAHHDPELGGGPWGSLLPERNVEKTRGPANMGSPDVPLDSWVYPALERLSALGYLQTAYSGIRPWTRMECARMLEGAGESIPGDDAENDQATKILADLNAEFEQETSRLDGSANLGANLDSVYTRVTGISGRTLRDSYHFGQTIINDYGRPYGEGFNNVTGITAHAVAGPFSVSIQGEYQHATAVASDPLSVLRATAAQDETIPFPNGRPEINRFRLLDSSVGFAFGSIQFSFGKQSLWLGPGEAGPLLMSDNAEPIPMLRIATVAPRTIPLLSRILGPARTEFFLGQLSGHHWELDFPTLLGPDITPQPFIQGEKIGFKPTPNLEFGMGITAIFVGPGLPFTWSNFLRTYYAHSTNARTNPGKRTSTADFSYRLPGMRKWLTLYMDSMVVDEISPIGSTRATVNPGIYMPQIPKVPRLELRAEGLHESLTNEFGPGFIYTDARRFRDGYTNNGLLMGSWIGRAGLGGQGWLTYSFSPRAHLQLVYRHQEAAKGFIGGGRLNDYSVAGRVRLASSVEFSGSLQYEQWKFPVLFSTRQSNYAAAVQWTFYPRFSRGR